MGNRIEVNKEIQSSSRHEFLRYLIIVLIGMVLPVSLWVLNYGKIESSIWWGFFTVVMILVTVTSFLIGSIKAIITIKSMIHYRKILTMYSEIDEQTHIPQTAIVTTCLRPDTGRFGFQKINYYFWIDATELVFFPVRPDFSSSKSYRIVRSIRLNGVMIRSYSLIGNQYDDGVIAVQDDIEAMGHLSYRSSTNQPVFRDTRATLLAYALGEQTIYLAFDIRLFERMNELIPGKNRCSIEASEKQTEPLFVSDPINSTVEIHEPFLYEDPLAENPKNNIINK